MDSSLDDTTFSANLTSEANFPLIALLCLKLYLKSVTIVVEKSAKGDINSDVLKSFSSYFISLNIVSDVAKSNGNSYLLFNPSKDKVSSVLGLKPNTVFISVEDPLSLKNIVIPSNTAFYSIVKSNETWKCFIKFCPTPEYQEKICEMATWENEKRIWIRNADLDCFRKIFYDMKGIVIKLGSVLADKTSHLNATVQTWNTIQHYLGFEFEHVVRQVRMSETVAIAHLFPLLISRKVDGITTMAFVTTARVKVMDFVMVGFDAKYHFVVRKPEFEPVTWEAIVQTFSMEVWLCVLFMNLLMAAILWATSNMTFPDSLFFITGLICNQGQPNDPENASGKVTFFVALVYSFLLWETFGSAYYSFLSARRLSLPFQSIEEFIHKKSHSLVVYNGTSLYSDLQNGSTPILKQIWEQFLKNDPGHAITRINIAAAFKKVCDGKATILAPPADYYFKNIPCDVVKIEPGYFGSGIAVPLRKGFPFLKQFQITLIRALEYGIIRKILYDSQTISNVVSKNVVLEPVSFQQVTFMFFLYGVCVIFSFVQFFLEVMFKRNNRSKKSKLN